MTLPFIHPLGASSLMTVFLLKTLSASVIIAFCSWLAGRRPEIAGFLIALPLVSVIAILFSYLEHRQLATSIQFAKSILVGVPISLLFFIPFLIAERWQLNFWSCYILGLSLLIMGYYLHKTIIQIL